MKLRLQMLQCMASHDISEIGTLLLCSTYFNFNIFNVILRAKHATSQNHVFRLARLRQTTVRNTHSKPRFLARGGRSAVSAIRRPSSFEDGSQNVPNPKCASLLNDALKNTCHGATPAAQKGTGRWRPPRSHCHYRSSHCIGFGSFGV